MLDEIPGHLICGAVLWPIALLVMAVWSDLQNRHIEDRHERGYSPRCNYNLRGNKTGRCPECGQKFVWRKTKSRGG